MNLKPHQVDLIINSGPVRDEFTQKVKELDRRLKMNGMDYKQWDTLQTISTRSLQIICSLTASVLLVQRIMSKAQFLAAAAPT